MKVVITGDKRINRALQRLSSKDAKKAFRKAARPAIKPVMQQARGNAKRNRRTGKLDKSFKVRSIPRSRSRIGVRVTTREQDFQRQFYAAYQEFGWKAGKAKRKIEGRDNLKNAADTKRRPVIEDYKRRLKQQIEELAT